MKAGQITNPPRLFAVQPLKVESVDFVAARRLAVAPQQHMKPLVTEATTLMRKLAPLAPTATSQAYKASGPADCEVNQIDFALKRFLEPSLLCPNGKIFKEFNMSAGTLRENAGMDATKGASSNDRGGSVWLGVGRSKRVLRRHDGGRWLHR